MQFRTPFVPAPSSLRLSVKQPLLLIGSCFATNVGALMRGSLWNVDVNPCGTLFNPASVARAVELALGKAEFSGVWQDDKGIWRSWDFPTEFAALSAEECAERCLKALANLRNALAQSQALVATFGTSFLYELKDKPGRVVANCHKQPSSLFCRRLMPADEIVATWSRTFRLCKDFNPNLTFILTLSPVRHLRDGFDGNSLSKANLRVAIARLVDECADAVYFPSFEIVTDDLRDYRFYADDMVHPSAATSKYVFDLFCDTFLPAEDINILKRGRSLLARSAHRPILLGSPEGKEFIRQTALLTAEWQRNFPTMLQPSILSPND